MNNAWIGLVTAAAAALLAAAPPPDAAAGDLKLASGRGSFTFGEPDEHDGDSGVAFFDFDVRLERGKAPQGTLLMAAEHHYPDVIVRIVKIEHATISGRTLKIRTHGRLHDEDVLVEAAAYDGDDEGERDTLAVKCTNAAGKVVFEADGEVASGDVLVGVED